MKLLNDLRNDETHFYIDNLFLSDENFCKLHNFMIVLYKSVIKSILTRNKKLPCQNDNEDQLYHKYANYDDSKRYRDNYNSDLTFERTEFQTFSARTTISNHELIEKIQKAYNQHYDKAGCFDKIFKPESLLEYAALFTKYIEDYYCEEIYAVLVSLKTTKLIDLKEDIGTRTDSEGNNEEEFSCGYTINFKF